MNGKPDLVEKYCQKHPPEKSTRSRCYLCQDLGLKGDPLNHWAGDHNPHLAAMLESIDDGAGQIMKTLEELSLLENTILIFTSDNGGEAPNVTSNAPLRGGKSQLYKGGVRVPLIIHCPRKLSRVEKFISHSKYGLLSHFFRSLRYDMTKTNPRWSVNSSPDFRGAGSRLLLALSFAISAFLGGISAGSVRSGDWKLSNHSKLIHLKSLVKTTLKKNITWHTLTPKSRR